VGIASLLGGVDDVVEAAAGGRRDGGRHGTLDDRGVDQLDVPVGA
jgi:hypothetical protein